MTPARKLYSLSRKAEFISIYCPVVQSRTYMIATVFWNKTAEDNKTSRHPPVCPGHPPPVSGAL